MNKKDRKFFKKLMKSIRLISVSMNPEISEASRKGELDVGIRKLKSWITRHKQELNDMYDNVFENAK